MANNHSQKRSEGLKPLFKETGLKALEHLNVILQKWDSGVIPSPIALNALQQAERYLALALGRLKGIPEEAVKPTEAAELLGVTYKRIHAMLHANPSRFPHAYREGNNWLIPIADIELVKNRKVGRPVGWRKNKMS